MAWKLIKEISDKLEVYEEEAPPTTPPEEAPPEAPPEEVPPVIPPEEEVPIKEYEVPETEGLAFRITGQGEITGEIGYELPTTPTTPTTPPEVQPLVESILYKELRKWYKNNVNIENADWSFDVTNKVKQVYPNINKAILYGWYKIQYYEHAGKTRPPKRNVKDIVNDWINELERALLYIDRNGYPELAEHPELEGWYWVHVPCKLTTQPPLPKEVSPVEKTIRETEKTIREIIRKGEVIKLLKVKKNWLWILLIIITIIGGFMVIKHEHKTKKEIST